MRPPLPPHTTLAFDIGSREPQLDLRIDALRLAVDVHLATLQLPERERPYLGEQLHTTARAIARRLSRARVVGVRLSSSRCERAAARLVYLLRLARDLRWLSPAVVSMLEAQAEQIRATLARESDSADAPTPLDAVPTRRVSTDELATVALVAERPRRAILAAQTRAYSARSC